MANKIEQWCESIQSHEGWILPCTKYPAGSASFRNNNPGNFRCSSLVMGELGATKCVNNLAVFPNYETGFKALKQFLIYACTDKLRSYKSTMTLLDFYKVYAPSSDNNNPLNYATCVAKDLGISINTQIKELYEPMQTPETPVQLFKVFSQNDPIWKNDKIGGTNLTVGNYGCTTSCVSDGGTWFGEIITPKELASHKELYTSGGLIIWKMIKTIFKKMKFFYRYYSFNESIIDKYLIINPNTVVLLNVDRGYHWVFALSKGNGGYTCSDPYPYLAKKRFYSFNDIDGFTVLIKKEEVIPQPTCIHCSIHCPK